jgi:hypothetical protein
MPQPGPGERGSRLIAQLQDLALELGVASGAIALGQVDDLGEKCLGVALGNGRR